MFEYIETNHSSQMYVHTFVLHNKIDEKRYHLIANNQFPYVSEKSEMSNSLLIWKNQELSVL